MSSAILYAGLVGKYISMDRDATEAELGVGEPPTIGMECLVTQVFDAAPGVVTICSDYGYAFSVGPDHSIWRFHIWPDEDTAKQHR